MIRAVIFLLLQFFAFSSIKAQLSVKDSINKLLNYQFDVDDIDILDIKVLDEKAADKLYINNLTITIDGITSGMKLAIEQSRELRYILEKCDSLLRITTNYTDILKIDSICSPVAKEIEHYSNYWLKGKNIIDSIDSTTSSSLKTPIYIDSNKGYYLVILCKLNRRHSILLFFGEDCNLSNKYNTYSSMFINKVVKWEIGLTSY